MQDRPRIGRPVTACTPRNREVIRKRIQRNSKRSMRSMAKSLKIDEKSVRVMVKNQLKYFPYKIQEAHFLDDRMKANRLVKARKMRRLAAAGRHRLVLFTDEKIFTIEQAHNHQNDRQLLPKDRSSLCKAEMVSRSHFPASVMVWLECVAQGRHHWFSFRKV